MTSIPTLPRLAPTGYAEPKERAAKIAVLDEFGGDHLGFPHGEAVESVLIGRSDYRDPDIQRMQNAPAQADLRATLEQGGVGFQEAFRATTAFNVQEMYRHSAQSLRTVLTEQPTVKVVAQPQEESSARQLQTVFQGLAGSEAFRSQVARSLGLAADSSVAQVAEELLHQADLVQQEDEECVAARQEFVQVCREAYDAGVTYLVAAGNHGDFAAELESLGVKASPSAFRNILVNDFVTVVGAVDRAGEAAPFNSPNSGIEVRALGVDLPWTSGSESGSASGTSFAVPIAAAQAARLLEQRPEFGPFEVETSLMGLESYRVEHGGAVATVGNGRELIGDGRVEGYILEQLGPGFVTDIYGEEALQLARAQQPSTLFGLPGEREHEFQLITVRPNPEGVRELTLDTYFADGHHRLRAQERGGAWDPTTSREEMHLDHERKRALEGNQALQS